MDIFVENSDLKGYTHPQVTNDKQGYRGLLRWLREHDVDAPTCTYGMEHTGFYSDGLQHFLDKKGYKYTMLEPAVIKHYPIQPSEKNDRLDAAKIAVVHDGELKRFYERKCNGKDDADTVRKAMNAVKFKLVLRMFAVVRQKHAYRQFTTI